MASDPDSNTRRQPQWIARLLSAVGWRPSPLEEENRTLRSLVGEQEREIRLLKSLLGPERKRSAQFNLLREVELQLRPILDRPVAAQLVCNAICKVLRCNMAAVFLYEAAQRELVLFTSAGQKKGDKPSYRQSIERGVMGRAARLRQPVIVHDTTADPDFVPCELCLPRSEVAVPLTLHGKLRGMLVVDSETPSAFDNTDAAALEIVAENLLAAWERSSYQERLTFVMQEGVKLSILVETQMVLESIVRVSRQALESQFVFVALIGEDGHFTRTASAGNAPQLLRSIERSAASDPLIRTILKTPDVIHLRDIRKSGLTSHLRTDSRTCRDLLACPIRLHEAKIGIIMAFGKQDEGAFSENDFFLARLIATQAAGALESARLYQEVRSNLQTAAALYQLSGQILQAADLCQAAEAILTTAYRISEASLGGILLYAADREEICSLQMDAAGIQTGASAPTEIIQQTIETGQSIVMSTDRYASLVCLPLQTQHHSYGALWLDLPEGRWHNPRYAASLQTLAQQASSAIERAHLLERTRQQAAQLEQAYHELEANYDKTLAALVSALDARDRETEGHSTRVGAIASRLGQYLGLPASEIKALERGGLLHDIGKIGIPDTILLKPGTLSEEEWQIMRQHPEIGARIVANVAFLNDVIPIIRCHHERWDGSGYPQGLKGEQIPLLGRIFAIADTFDALISDRPYRKGVFLKTAIAYLEEHAGILFDPEIVAAFIQMLQEERFKDFLPS